MKRRAWVCAALGAASLALPALASSRRVLAAMTAGPFYPAPAWRRRQHGDWDADLTRVERGSQVAVARGEHIGLEAAVLDTHGRAVDGAEVEIWQCDVQSAYRHPSVNADPASFDAGFQGFGSARSDARGALAFRTIKPVPYPGRTPHIHVTIRHASFGELTSQLFVAGDPGNARDFLWRRLDAADRAALEMTLVAAPADSGLRWTVRQALVVPS